uniref:HNH homing endonuclease n=4 Tax=unclassified bacterial viruses TaxID=12333 RepID=A0AAU6W1N0_9VIRU
MARIPDEEWVCKEQGMLTTPCVIWARSVDREGYGRASVGGKSYRAHRVAYAKANGLDPATMGGVVMHLCDVPSCVNPDHLKLGTHRANMDDMLAKGRQPKGEKKRLSKLTAAQVSEARVRYKRGCPTYGATPMAAAFGVSVSTLCKALRGETWV